MKNKTFEELYNYRQSYASKLFKDYLNSNNIILEDIKDDETKFMEVFQEYEMSKKINRQNKPIKIVTEQDKWNTKMKYKYASYKRSPETRDIKFDILKEDFFKLIQQECVYCGGTNNSGLNGLDRVDSTDYYRLENVVPCCGICNMMKRAYSREFFLEHIKRMYSYTIKEIK